MQSARSGRACAPQTSEDRTRHAQRCREWQDGTLIEDSRSPPLAVAGSWVGFLPRGARSCSLYFRSPYTDL